MHFDGASNVQKAGCNISVKFLKVTKIHDTEYFGSFFFGDVLREDCLGILKTFTRIVSSIDYESIQNSYCIPYINVLNLPLKLRNIFGSTCHSEHSMFKEEAPKFFKNCKVGFIKPSECRMAGEIIAFLSLIRLKPTLQSLVKSPEFLELNKHRKVTIAIRKECIWDYYFAYFVMHLCYNAYHLSC